MANVPVLIEGAGGSRDTLVTGNDGTISISRLEADDYSLTVDVEDCNFYKGTWTVSASGSNNFTIQLTRPEVKLSTDDIHVDMNVEDKLEKTVDIKNEGDGEVVWRMLQDNPAGSGDISSRFQLQKDFNASGDLQSAVVFDGEFFYTSSWYNVGQFYKYDKNGEFLEEFHVEDAAQVGEPPPVGPCDVSLVPYGVAHEIAGVVYMEIDLFLGKSPAEPCNAGGEGIDAIIGRLCVYGAKYVDNSKC